MTHNADTFFALTVLGQGLPEISVAHAMALEAMSLPSYAAVADFAEPRGTNKMMMRGIAGGLAEQVTADSWHRQGPRPVIAFDGGRICSSIQRCEPECKALNEAEKRALRQDNQKMGYREDECALVLYGKGGFARIAIDTTKAYVGKVQHGMLPHQRNRHKVQFVLVAPSNRWSAKDYGLRDNEGLCLDRDQGNIEQRLKQYGGTQLTCCIVQLNKGVEQVLDGRR
ncbi:hypothetical protein JCM10207_000272 [Rhodosporidiobolus poonsookiae]